MVAADPSGDGNSDSAVATRGKKQAMRSSSDLFFALAVAFATVVAGPVRAQLPTPEPPVFGVDYSFERMVATRMVNDRHDRGPVSLTSYVYRPLKKDAGVVVMALHGSTAGWLASPAEPVSVRQVPLEFLLERGFTVVVPMRRGRGESGGTYIEECPYQTGKCSLADYRTGSEAGLADALASTDAVFEQVVLRRLKPRSGKVLLLGLSRGGFIALHFAASHPQQVEGVIAVSPGLLSVSDKWPAEENATRVNLLQKMVARVGADYRGPTLWVYAARDPFYRDSFPRQLFSSFHAAGGRGEYVSIDEHSLPHGHVPPFDLWRPAAERILRSIESAR